MSITIEVTRIFEGGHATFKTTADSKEAADTLARFLLGGEIERGAVTAAASLPKISDKLKANTEALVKAEKEPEAKKEQPAPATDTTLESGQASSGSESASDAGKAYSYDQVKQLITDLVKVGKRDMVVALLSRFGMKVLAKDATVETYNEMGTMAEGTLAGTVDPREAVEA